MKSLQRWFFEGISKSTGFHSSEVPQPLVEKLKAKEQENQALLARLAKLEALAKPAEPVKDPRLDGLLDKISQLEDRLKTSGKKRPKGKKSDESDDDDESTQDEQDSTITTPSGQTVPLMIFDA